MPPISPKLNDPIISPNPFNGFGFINVDDSYSYLFRVDIPKIVPENPPNIMANGKCLEYVDDIF